MKVKGIIGIVLVAASIAGIFFWETEFRDRLLLQEVLVASKDIQKGEVFDENSFRVLSVTKESVIENALYPKDISSVIGLVSSGRIKEKAQISMDDLVPFMDLDPEDSFTMVIPSEWIFLRNNELKAGDKVFIYSMPEKEYFGSYNVKMIGSDEDPFVEIQIALEDYFSIYDEIMSYKNSNKFGSSNCLMLVSERSLL